jgi:hypothetical protein
MPGAFNRRQTLALGLASTVAGAGAGAGAAAAAPDSGPAQPSLLDDARHYASLGPHRTGSPGNLRTLDWIERRLSAIGFRVDRQPIRYPDHAVRQALIRVGDLTIEGIAQHPVCPTGADGLRAPLILADDQAGRIDVRGRIAVVRLPHARHSSILEARSAGPIRAALDAGCAGLVLVTRGPSADALALNAPVEHPISAVPALVIAPRDANPLIAAAARGDEARLVMDAVAAPAVSANLVAHRPGRGRSIVVSTPLSGWFACAGERGSGVAAFLKLARLLADTQPDAELLFTGFVGHEREYVGGDLFMQERAPPREQVRLWVHIGAGFAARDWHEISDTQLMPLPSTDAQRYLLVPAGWIDQIRPTLRGLLGYEVPYPSTVENSSGEARHIMQRGYAQMISTVGAHRLHHSRRDDAQTLDAAGLEASWDGWSRMLLQVLKQQAAN